MGNLLTYNLADLSISAKGEEHPFFIDNENKGVYHWMKKGCGVASSAMILRNIGKTMLGYDYRTDFYGYMLADPFTVMLANCQLDGTDMTTNTRFLNTGIQYPNSLTIQNVCDGFKVSHQFVGTSEASLKRAVDDYGYVLIYFSKTINGKEYPHFMVITGFTTGNSLEDRMLVLDPAADSYVAGAGQNGNGVPLSKTASGYANLNNVVIKNARVYK